MEDVVHQLSRTSWVGLDAFVGTRSTAKLYLFLERHVLFVELDKDFNCLQNFFPNCVEFYASQLLNDISNLTGDNQLRKSARVQMSAVKCKRFGELLDS